MAKSRRSEYDAAQKRRSIAIASASTIFVVLALIILVPMTPGWEKVQKSFFNTAVLYKSFPKLMDAFKVNVMIFAWSAPAIAVLG
jgi:polar amino acid transport system permease protein